MKNFERLKMIEDCTIDHYTWFPILIDLNNRLQRIDPDYRLISVKEKFGELRFRYQTEYYLRPSMDKWVALAEEQCWNATEQSRLFDRVAPKPSLPYEGFKW